MRTIYDGDTIVDGISVKDKKKLIQLRTETGMVFQQLNLFPHKTVLENVTLAPTGFSFRGGSNSGWLSPGALP
jgi:ABC-type polar amino acid transport system ATPase subunit